MIERLLIRLGLRRERTELEKLVDEQARKIRRSPERKQLASEGAEAVQKLRSGNLKMKGDV